MNEVSIKIQQPNPHRTPATIEIEYLVPEEKLEQLFTFLAKYKELLQPLPPYYKLMTNQDARLPEDLLSEGAYYSVLRLAMALYAIPSNLLVQFLGNPSLDLMKDLIKACPAQVLSLLSCGGYLAIDECGQKLDPELLDKEMQSASLEDCPVFDLDRQEFLDPEALKRQFIENVLSDSSNSIDTREGNAIELDRQVSAAMPIQAIILSFTKGEYGQPPMPEVQTLELTEENVSAYAPDGGEGLIITARDVAFGDFNADSEDEEENQYFGPGAGA